VRSNIPWLYLLSRRGWSVLGATSGDPASPYIRCSKDLQQESCSDPSGLCGAKNLRSVLEKREDSMFDGAMARIIKTAVIGAGPAGCVAAHEAARAGRKVVLFEKEKAVGGRTLTHRSGGHVLDTGAGFFTNFYPRLKSYNRALGLESDVVRLSRQNVLISDHRIAPLALGSPLSFFRFPLVGAADKIRMLGVTLGRTLRYRGVDLADPASLAALDTDSIARDARKFLGESVYQYLVRPGIEPFWYFSCEEVSKALYIGLQAKAADAVFFTYGSGMDSFCRKLAESVELRTGKSVTSIGEKPRGFSIRFSDDKEDFDEIILATTANVAAKLTAKLSESVVSANQKHFLQSQMYAANVIVSFRLPAGVLPDSDTRIPCGTGENPVAAITSNSDKRAGHSGEDLVSIYLRGDEAKKLLKSKQKEAFARALALARKVDSRLIKLPLEPFYMKQRENAIPVHSVGRYRQAATFLEEQSGPIVFAGDYLANATVEGAIHSAQSAVAALLKGAGLR
tara:strand:+ start:25201 stop:26730 length:1530 start_codon:yes stop_codon:yes gene_type:complete